MRRLLVFCLLVVNLDCLGLVWFSLWPGLLEDVVFDTVLIAIPTIPLAVVTLMIVLWRRHGWPQVIRVVRLDLRQLVWPKRLTLLTIVIALTTQLLLTAEIPRKVAFHLSRPAFEAARINAPTTRFSDQALNQRLGIYWISYYGADDQGGVYFMTGSHGFIFRDTYGIAYRPQPGSNPFGNQGNEYHSLSQDWYWFKAHFDW